MKSCCGAKNQLFVICATVFISSVLTSDISLTFKLIAAACSVAAAVLAVILYRVGKLARESVVTALCVFLSVAASLAITSVAISMPMNRAKDLSGKDYYVTAEITEVNHRSEYYGYYTARIRSDSWRGAVNVSLEFPDGGGTVGDIFCGNVILSLPESDGAYDEAAMLRADGIYLTAQSDGMEYSAHSDGFSLLRIAEAVNRALTSRIYEASDGKSALAPAVLLGRRDLLDQSVKRDFSRLGISHLLAVSGLHLSVIAAGVELILRRTRLSSGVRCSILAAVVLSFIGITGFSPSAVRAGIMTLVRIAAVFIGRQGDPATSLSFAAAAMVTVRPNLAFDTGLILSVFATYGCILFAYRSRERESRRITKRGLPRKIAYYVSDVVSLTLIITALTLPVMWRVFGEVSIVSPLTNLLFVPAISLILYLSFPLILFCHVPLLSSFFAWILTSLENLVLRAASWLSHLPHIVLSLRHVGAGLLSVIIFLSVIAVLTVGRNKRYMRILRCGVAVSCTGFVCAIVTFAVISSGTANITFLTQGKNEGFIMRCGMREVLIDISDGSAGFAGELLYSARCEGASEIEAVVLTHYHMKNMSGISMLTERAIIRRLILPEPVCDSDLSVCESLLSICQERGVKCEFYARKNGESIDVNGVELSFFDLVELSRSDHPVVAFEAWLGGRHAVYAGGSSSEGDTALADALFLSDLAVFGSHPPVYKVPFEVGAGGNAVFTEDALASGCLADVAIGGEFVILERDGSYSCGNYEIR